MMIEDDDILFLSIVDDFIAPTSHFSEGSTAEHQKLNGTMEHEKIPHSIGGYKVGEVLGRGGFGVVCVGEHHLTGERVALKFLKKSEILSLGAAERTNTEIQCLTALKHMNIIRLQQVRDIFVFAFPLITVASKSTNVLKMLNCILGSYLCSMPSRSTTWCWYSN
jgi:serine/threonine protein kinase